MLAEVDAEPASGSGQDADLRRILVALLARDARSEVGLPTLRHYVRICSPQPANDNGRPAPATLISVALEAVPGAYHSRSPQGVGGVRIRDGWRKRVGLALSRWQGEDEVGDMPTEWKTPLDVARGRRLRGSRLHELVEELHFRRTINEPYFQRAGRYLYDADWSAFPVRHRAIWELHCAGAGSREVSRRLRMPVATVLLILKRHRVLAERETAEDG